MKDSCYAENGLYLGITMKKKHKKFLKKSLKNLRLLPPAYYYTGLIGICIGLFTLSWLGRKPEPQTKFDFQIELVNLDYSATPDERSPVKNLHVRLQSESGPGVKSTQAIQAKARSLENEIQSIVSGGSASALAPISRNFRAVGIDRNRFLTKFDDEPIAVQRWQTSESAPTFSDDSPFEKFIENALEPWLGTSDFRISLNAYATSIEGDNIRADFVAETYGRTNSEKGIQATSMWRTTWDSMGAGYTLTSIRVIAQEEVSVHVDGGQLLLDCTDSIFQHCDTLNKQLRYGVDHWARRMPGIDIVGNHGVAVGDINQDGLDDIYICQPHGLPNRLLIQNPDGTVEDVSAVSQLDILDESHGALMIDLDNDHDQDLVVSTDENLILMSNRNDGTFQLEHVLPIGRNAHSITAADYDQDGDLDLYLCKFQDVTRQNDILMFPTRIQTADDGGRNVLLRNDEGWKFKDATEECGITTNNRHYSRSAIWHDYDRDGDLDLYVANEYSTDQFFENQQGWFADISIKMGLNSSARHRSVSLGEFNQDGRQDLFVATNAPLSAQRHMNQIASELPDGGLSKAFAKSMIGESQILFSPDSGQEFAPFFLRAPIFSSQSAYSSASADLNNDGLDDVIVSNGFVSRQGDDVDEMLFAKAFKPNLVERVGVDDSEGTDDSESLAISIAETAHVISDLCRQGYSVSGKQRNRCYLSIGALGFANMSALSGIDLPDDARGVATTDWDGDGDADVVVTCRSAPQIRILCNQLQSNNSFVHFDLIGTESNRDAIGARVELYLAGHNAPLVKSLTAGSGNLSQSSKRIMFGVGKSAEIEQAKIIWPNGNEQVFTGLVPNRRYEIVEGREQAAENTNERFELAISPRIVNLPTEQLKTGKRSIFYPRPVIPKLQFQTEADKWYSVEPVNEKPILTVFWTNEAKSQRVLKDLADAKSRFESNELDCLALLAIEDGDHDPAVELAYSKQVTEKLEFPFLAGTVAPSTIDKLSYLNGEWFSNHQLPDMPFAMLLDTDGRVAAFYPRDDFDTDKIFEDLKMISSPDWQYRMAASPLGGRWIAPYRFAKLNRLRTRLKEVGYVDDAKRMADQTRDQLAFEICQKAIELDSQGDSTQSKRRFQEALSIDPDCVMAYIGEGNLRRRMTLERSFAKEEEKVQLQQLALADYEHAIELDPFNTEAIIGRANIAIDQGRIDEALKQLKEFVRIEPTRYEIHAIIGRLLFHQKKPQEAAKFLVRAFENRPSLPYVAGDLGFLYLGEREYEQAQKFLRLANRLQPSDKNMLRLLAEAEFVLGNFDEAAKLFERVAKLDPNRPRSKIVLAWLLATCPYESHRDGDRAMEMMDPMVKIHGANSPSALEIYAACFAEIGDFEQALKFQEQAIELVDSKNSTDNYSADQKEGMRARFELFKRKRPYRTADVTQIPIQTPGRKR